MNTIGVIIESLFLCWNCLYAVMFGTGSFLTIRFYPNPMIIIFHMSIIQMLNKFHTDAVIKVESKLFAENFEKSHNEALYGNFVKTPEFKCYNEAIKDVTEFSLSFERMIQGSYASFVGLAIICITSLLISISLSLGFIIQKWFFIMTILVFTILLLVIKIWRNVGAIHTETIKCLYSLNTKLSNEKEKFEKNQ